MQKFEVKMRCYAILSNVPDILFFTADDEYKARLRAKAGPARPGDGDAMVRPRPLTRPPLQKI
jgi:hypothetical protein